MASQRVTLAKVGGLAADTIVKRSSRWVAARETTDPKEWSPDQWPQQLRNEAEAFADRLRTHCCTPPVVYFVEWSDLWSMGDVFRNWLTPPRGRDPTWIYGDRYEILGYVLPDGGRLSRHLAGAGPQQADEYDQLIARLTEAVGAWEGLVERAVLVLIREPVGGLVTDEELTESLSFMPNWLSET